MAAKQASKPAKGELKFNPTPECCGKKLGNGYPEIICKICGTIYDGDSMLEAMLYYRAGMAIPPVNAR